MDFIHSKIQTLIVGVGRRNSREVLLTTLKEILELVCAENDLHKTRAYVESIMNRDAGLIQFMKEFKNLNGIDKEIVNKSFEILEYLLTDCRDLLIEYTDEIFKLCNECIRWSRMEPAKSKSYNLLYCLIKNINPFFREYPDKLSNLLKDTLLRTESSGSSIEKKEIYKLIGAILEFYPDIATSHSQQIFRKLKSELMKLLFKDKSLKITELEGIFECLGSYLIHFSDTVEANDEDLYSVIRKGCELDSYRRTSIRIALKVMGRHIRMFADKIYEDREWWYETLNGYLDSQNKDDSTAAFEVLDIFYLNMADMLKRKFDTNDVLTLRLFVKKLKEDMRKSEGKRVTLAMKNMSHYASACSSHGLRDDVKEMFALTAEMAERCCLGIMETNIEEYHLSDLLVSVTGIIRNLDASDLTEYKFDILGKLCVFVIVSYPQIPSPFQIKVKLSLIITIVNVELSHPSFLDSFLEKIIYVSLMKSCAYLSEDDSEFIKEIAEVNHDELVSFKTFIPLWQDLCNVLGVSYLESLSEFDRREISEKKINVKIFNKFMAVILYMMDKLDLSVLNEESQESYYGLKPKNENDLYIFTNLVELVSAVIRNCDMNMLKTWIQDLIFQFVKHSLHCPIKSGYYRLLTALFKKYGHESDFENLVNINDLKSFLHYVLANIFELKEADLILSLSMVLNAPECVTQYILPHMEELFKIVFTLGLDNLWLAAEGLATFETWYFSASKDYVEPVLLAVVPYFNLYLGDKKFSGDADDITKYEKQLLTSFIAQRKNKIYRKFKRVQANPENKELLTLQVRIAKFLSQIDIDSVGPIYKSKDCTIQKINEYLKFELPFHDMKVKIFLDKFAPRVIELATNSSDLQTRTVACELLHSTVTIFIGNSVCDRGLSRPDYAENLPKSLLTCVLKLGSDINEIMKQMFRPLCHQLAHYYSGNFLPTDYSETNIFLEILFDGICNKNDAALRYICAELIHEFIKGSMKKENSNSNYSNTEVPANITNVISRICLFCLLPCCYKKLGAALAFNSIYQDLREQLSVINICWIELLYHFVRNLSLSSDSDCNNREAVMALKHLKRVLHEKSDIFNQKNILRKVPKSMNEGTLADVVSWLLNYCISENEHCRKECINLVTDLSTQLPGCQSLNNHFDNLSSERKNELLELFFEHGQLNREFFKCSDTNINIRVETYAREVAQRILKWLNSLLISLDCFYWLYKENVISYDHLWNGNVDVIESVRFFNEFVLPVSLEKYVEILLHCDCKPFLTERSKMSFAFVKHQIFLRLLDLSIVSDTFLEPFIDKIFHENFWNIFVQFIFEPPRRFQNFSSNKHAEVIRDTFACLKKLSSLKFSSLCTKIRDYHYGSTFWPSLTGQNFEPVSDLKSRQYLNGLFLLQESSILPIIVPDIASRKKVILINVFNSLNRNNVAIEFDSSIVSFVENVIRFSLVNMQVENVAELIFKPDELSLQKSNLTVSWGRHFFCMFKEPLKAYFNNHQQYLISECLTRPQCVTNLKIQIILDFVVNNNNSKTVFSYRDLINGIFENWVVLNQWSIENPNNSCRLFDLIKNIVDEYKKLEKYNPQCLRFVFLWLLRHLINRMSPVLTKKQILELLPPFMVTKNEEINNDFQDYLKVFYEQSFVSFNDEVIRETDFILLFNALLSILNKTKNIVVLRYIIYIRAATDRSCCDDIIQQDMKTALSEISTDYQLQFCTVPYEICRIERTIEVKLRCAQIFLIPMLHLVSPESFTKFFTINFKYILESLEQGPVYVEQNAELSFLGKQIISVLLTETYTDIIKDFDCPEVKQNTYPDEKTSLKKEVCKIVREILSKRGSNSSLHRKLRCHSYNVLIKIIKKIQNEKFYPMLFTEEPKKEKYIWKNIVDCEEVIELKMFVENIASQKKKINKKRKELQNSYRNTYSVCSISTQCLTASSLVEDVAKFDMSGWNVSDNQYSEETEKFVELEDDIFNNHECMPVLCELLNSMEEHRISPASPNDQENSQPLWMKNLNDSLIYYLQENTQNVIMFILKLIMNCEATFRPYVNNWLDLIVRCIIFLGKVNYFTADLTTMLLNWPLPSSSNKRGINKLIKMLISKVDFGSTTIRNYQMELIGAAIEKWHGLMDSIEEELLKLMNEKDATSWEVCLLISKRLLRHGVFPVISENKNNFIEKLLFLTKNESKRNVTLLAYEAHALVLRWSEEKEDILSPVEFRELNEKLVNHLNDLKASKTKTRIDLFFSCLHRVVIIYPKVLNSFVTYLSSSFSQFQGIIKSKCLKIFAQCTSYLPKDTFSQLMNQGFVYCLRESDDYDLLKSALEMIKFHSDGISKNEIDYLLNDITSLSSHSVPECRELIYEISRRIYLKYRTNVSENYVKIKDRLKAILLNGLRDNDNELQQNSLSFWKQFIENKPVQSVFIDILRETYSSYNESQFVCNAADFLLEACFSTPDIESKIFDNPISRNYPFEHYQISRFSRSNASVTPAFVNSFCSQSMFSFRSNNMPYTQRESWGNLMFQPTANILPSTSVSNVPGSLSGSTCFVDAQADSSGIRSYISDDKHKGSDSDFALKKLKRRLHQNPNEIKESFISRNVKRRDYQKSLMEQTKKPKKSVNFHRQYRTGDLPDIEIPRSAVIKPLKVLARRDPVMGKSVFTSIFEEMLKKITEKKSYLDSVNEILNDMLKSTFQRDNIFIETIFEIAFNHSDIDLDSQYIVRSSDSDELLSLGALLIENKISRSLTPVSESHVTKKIKFNKNEMWAQLAELYQSLNQEDVVNGILEDKLMIDSGISLKNCIEFEQANDLERSWQIYEELATMLKRTDASYEKRFIREAYFKCAAHLSKWNKITDTVEQQFEDLSQLWEEAWDVERTLPWFFTAKSYTCLELEDTFDKFDVVNSWLKDEEKSPVLMNLIAEPLSMLMLLEGKATDSHTLINNCLQMMLENWYTNSMSKDKFLKLQILSEMETMLSVFHVPTKESVSNHVQSILKILERSSPAKNYLVSWEKRIMYRTFIMTKYKELLDPRADCKMLRNLEIAKVTSYSHFCARALDKGNYVVACKYLKRAYSVFDEAPYTKTLENDILFSLNYSKTLLLQALKSKPIEKLVEFKRCVDELNESKKSTKYEYDYHILVADVVSRILDNSAIFMINENEAFDLICSLQKLLDRFDIGKENILPLLREGILINYQKAADFAEKQNSSYLNISSAYLAIAKYCQKYLGNDTNLAYEKELIRSILKAMRFNSKDAEMLFPTLLQLRNITDSSVKDIFFRESKEVEEWKFLPWIEQLLVYADTDKAHIVEHIISRIVKKYPKALQFCTKRNDILHQNPGIVDLIKGLSNVRVPEEFYRHWCRELSRLCKCPSEEICDAMIKLETELNSDETFRGNLFTKCPLKYPLQICIDEIKKNIYNKTLISAAVSQFEKALADEMKKKQRHETVALSDFSPWLSRFKDMEIDDIELPGQYTGFSCPRPEEHIKIHGFVKKVQILNSLRQPIKIKIIGNNGKKYSYLLKYEDGICQDQRIQQIFSVLNSYSRNSKGVDENLLCTMTYGVFPLTRDFGMIEWLESTLTLDDFMDYGTEENEKRKLQAHREELRNKYVSSFKKLCPSLPTLYSVYEEVAKQCHESSTLFSFRKLCKEIPEDVFRKSLLALCNCPVQFWQLRNRFVISYSVMCIYNWILGIGDRHLKNTLVCLKTGNCIGIDFGYAFGMGIENILIPELIPFRMTPHIKSIMAPFYLTGFIRETMISCLRNIQENQYVLLSMLQIFILQPALNWENLAYNRICEEGGDCNSKRDLQWNHEQKIETVKHKLHGLNPVQVLTEQIRNNRVITTNYRSNCIRLLHKPHSKRLSEPIQDLNASQQIACLLDIATDENILAVCWQGLDSYI